MDWLMYNPNYDMFIYSNLEFTYRTGGIIEINLKLEAFRIK